MIFQSKFLASRFPDLHLRLAALELRPSLGREQGANVRLTEIQVRHFRNIERLAWWPAPGVNLIYGGNGQGKTNLLEAMHMAMLGRSFRTRGHDACLPWNAEPDQNDPTRAEAVIKRRRGDRRLRVALGRHFKRVWLDGGLVQRLGDLWGEAAVVSFTPEHVSLLKGPPGERRRWLDVELSLTSRTYLQALQRYNKAMRELNAVYKRFGREPRKGEASAAAFYPVLAEAGAIMIQHRARRLAEAAEALGERFSQLGGQGELRWRYESSSWIDAPELLALGTIRDKYLKALERDCSEAWRRGRCSTGPHRDDFGVWLQNRDLRQFGSQGQHRLAALTLQLESARCIETQQGEPPILLLDDFGSELDPDRRRAVLQSLRGRMQVFITATTPADFGGGQLFDQARELKSGSWTS